MAVKVFTAEDRRRAQEARKASAGQRRQRQATAASASVDALLRDAGPQPAYVTAHARRARAGNVRSLIALKCLDCCCWQREEVRLCSVTACPLHALRPYREVSA